MREFPVHTDKFAIVKSYYNKRAKTWRGDVISARPGLTRTEAWQNACDAARATRKEFKAAGWTCQRLIITGSQ